MTQKQIVRRDPEILGGTPVLSMILFFSTLIVVNPPTDGAENGIGKIVFTRGATLWTMNPDGTDQRSLGLRGDHPSWSPDGTQIVFDRPLPDLAILWSSRYSAIFIVDADGSNARQLTQVPAGVQKPVRDLSPAWSPDGKWIAFTSNRDGQLDIYQIDTSGNNLMNLAQGVTPARSPDGHQIAYCWDALYILHLKNGQKRRLTNGSCNSPSWSPDGKQIAFATLRGRATDLGRTTDLAIVDADGKNERHLTTHPQNEGGPSWSPDGSQIVFHADPDGRMEIYRLTLGSGEIEQLTDSLPSNVGPDKFNPDWSHAVNRTAIQPAQKQTVLWGELKTELTPRLPISSANN